jgi:predicted CXXCH cytochrome family protein
MKNFNFVLGAVVLAGLAAANATGQIVNSDHNFSTSGWSGGEICKPCHTPHFANVSAGRLWNHSLSTATYTMHDGSTGDSAAAFDKVSRLCMGCHDGTVALDAFGGSSGSPNITINATANVGTDLTNDHPVGAKAIYPTTATTPPRFNLANSSHSVVAAAGSLSLYPWVDGAGTTQYVVGCRTCHDPHNRGNYGHMLKFSNQSSQLCLACHVK